MKELLFVIFLVGSVHSFCQSGIKGKVLSEKGQPLQNASVFLPNSTTGVYTNEKGEFILVNLPSGSITIAVTYVGYEAANVTVPASARDREYVVTLKPQNNQLQGVVIQSPDGGGWKKWGRLFTDAFIGTSSYAGNCIIQNKENVRFAYSAGTNQLRAFCNEPLIIENKDLGYKITVTVVDFYYDLSTKVVDYQTYALFTEIQGSDIDRTIWKKNRVKVYALSILHFMRSLYENRLASEGYQVRLVERKANTEKYRVQRLYENVYSRIRDSLSTNKSKEQDLNKLVENSFPKDSLRYYRGVLTQEDRTEKIHKKTSGFDDIAKQKDSVTVILDCKDYMQVTYTRIKEPDEYLAYKNGSRTDNDIITETVNTPSAIKIHPMTELNLPQGIPVEINENGYYTNTDLFMNGFWGWWEKMATKLPYDYKP